MKKVVVQLTLIAVCFLETATLGSVRAASLQNTDNQAYDLILVEPGYRQVYRSPYQILEHSQVEFCFYGCEINLLSTGQGVTVGADDKVIISYGVMRVERNWRNTP
jgi:hypothetical protein